ncbi:MULTISPECIES: glycine oxidase ThiO [Salimicrobium]|uniref:glycine oxidase n=3 Tax=Salimicrobium TaxID=351195 RepID=K2FN59_9BACI|nr:MULTISPECIES: glycine oxidase ThiO [Salimicrobium]AKG05248.1 glycine oxidase ThiO [Salimicrobium jeotgali]EKE32366.1 glycine oxidase [Salimicrobium jeotgali]MBM7695659.1 glycine oxidase [Salimicrobium jeotgali]SDY10271.1 glycine oxidase [Salimicrobium album]SIS75301.1 glycine oxidase [Salimicrobium salexigens]
MYDVIIAGGGVIGSSIAFQLSKRNYRVLIIEKEEIGQKASRAAAGMLGAQNEVGPDSPLSRLARESREMFPSLAEELESVSGIDIELIQNGIVRVARTEEEAKQLKRENERQQRSGDCSEWLSRSRLQEREPRLSHLSVTGGLYMPGDGQVNAPSLTKALAHASVEFSTEIMEHTEVLDVLTENRHVTGVKTTSGNILAQTVISAGGTWSRELFEKTGYTLNMYPVKGECFSVYHKEHLTTASIFSPGCYIVPKAGGRFIVGATQKPDDPNNSVSIGGLRSLMERAIRLIPDLQHAEWGEAWSGHRPKTQTGLPYMGEHPEIDGLWVAAGHFRNGILLAPITGSLMADYIEGKPVYESFKIQ